jgi:hypothetical protein
LRRAEETPSVSPGVLEHLVNLRFLGIAIRRLLGNAALRHLSE